MVFWLKTRTIGYEVIVNQLWRVIIAQYCLPIAFLNCSKLGGGGTVREANCRGSGRRAYVVVHIKRYYGFLWGGHKIRGHRVVGG